MLAAVCYNPLMKSFITKAVPQQLCLQPQEFCWYLLTPLWWVIGLHFQAKLLTALFRGWLSSSFLNKRTLPSKYSDDSQKVRSIPKYFAVIIFHKNFWYWNCTFTVLSLSSHNPTQSFLNADDLIIHTFLDIKHSPKVYKHKGFGNGCFLQTPLFTLMSFYFVIQYCYSMGSLQ